MMKKQTIYVDLNGKIGDYVKRIRTNSITTDYQLKELQKSLNEIINSSKSMDATASNCEMVWSQLTATFKSITVKHKEYEVYKELLKAVDTIGGKIAYLCKKSGIKKEVCNSVDCSGKWRTDEGLLYEFKRYLLKSINNGTLKEEVTLYKTDQELLNMARKSLRVNGTKINEQRIAG